MDLDRWLGEATRAVQEWSAGFGPYQPHAALDVSDETFAPVFAEFTDRLRDNYPFFHPVTRARCSSRRTRPPSSATSPPC